MTMVNRIQYLASRLSEGLDEPMRALKYVTDSVAGKLRIRLNGCYVSPAEYSVLERSWDVLVILDACRYDSLDSRNPFGAPCQKRTSQAPNTAPWFHRNFVQASDEDLSDVVYLTANPKTAEILHDESRFCRFERVFQTHWDQSASSVLPEELTDIALKRGQQFPDNRLVVHYMQPHGPFVGASRPDLHQNGYRQLQRNEVSLDAVLDAYHTCLSRTLNEVERLVDGVSGKVVVTADHGESFGEAGVYAHPPWANSEVLLTVPWIEVEGRENPPQYETTAHENDREVSATIEDQLASLGYR